LNEYLKPYGLECTRVALSGMLTAFREYGLEIKEKGLWDKHGYWIENPLISSETLENLIFAVSTNPHLTQEQATAILSSLKPFVTVYQEPMLTSIYSSINGSDDRLRTIYNTVHQAVVQNKIVFYSKLSSPDEQLRMLPKCIYPLDGALYMVGYVPIERTIKAVSFDEINEIILYRQYWGCNKELTNQIFSEVNIEECIRNLKNTD